MKLSVMRRPCPASPLKLSAFRPACPDGRSSLCDSPLSDLPSPPERKPDPSPCRESESSRSLGPDTNEGRGPEDAPVPSPAPELLLCWSSERFVEFEPYNLLWSCIETPREGVL